MVLITLWQAESSMSFPLSVYETRHGTPGGANPRRGVHIHTFQVPHGSGRRVFAAPFM
ncbi:hypothetical protein Bwad001_24170 [Bilophila wadsworthia]